MGDLNRCSGIIKPISKNVVHQICSGQVILTLAVAVKELVENSIDAGAKIIDISLHEYGSELIQVSDNGSGVLEDNFQALTLKHYTSKIEDFSDLQRLETLGFRGEALSSLCALSDLTIITKHHSAEQAKKIKYDKNGEIVEVSLAARETGTTVILENLFSTLPVRRKDFMKNLKRREFGKLCQVLNAYCLIPNGIKITCTNSTEKGNKNVVAATLGSDKIRENIISIFGSKQIASLIDVKLVEPPQEILEEFNVKAYEIVFETDFLVSSVMHGSGRSSGDRQFFYINFRPVELAKISKLIHQIYKQFNSSQYPFIYLNINLKSSIVDVNVTPDKRQVFLEKENLILAAIKASLLEAFKVFPSSLPTQNQDISTFLRNSQKSQSKIAERKGIKRFSSDGNKDFLNSFRKKVKNDKSFRSLSDTSLLNETKITEYSQEKCVLKLEKFKSDFESKISKNCEEKVEEFNTSPDIFKQLNSTQDSEENTSPENDLKSPFKPGKFEENSSQSSFIEDDNIDKFTLLKEEKLLKTVHEDNVTIILDSPSKNISSKKRSYLKASLDLLKERLEEENSSLKSENDFKVKFHKEIAPENNKAAEDELRKEISKCDFEKMEIIGQFNLGFIIVKLDNDLFLIDQHASDEKYNFEQLQLKTVLQKQTLVNPKPLFLTAEDELLLIECEEVFNQNGFFFKIDHGAPANKKVLLTAVPMSQNMVFGKDEIDELLFMLRDDKSKNCRPSRLRAMFASRACRKSVMIGTKLSEKDMRNLVDHMGQIEQPWNCPHGRPTIRHLINLDLILKEM